MSSVNKQFLLGRVGKDPETRTLSNGAMVANFSIATSEKWTDKTTGEKREVTEWHNVICWRGLAEIASKYVKKGSQIYIEGKTTHRAYDAQDGSKRYITEVVASDLVLLGSPTGGSGAASSPYTSQYATPPQQSQPGGQPSGSNVDNTSGRPTDDLPF